MSTSATPPALATLRETCPRRRDRRLTLIEEGDRRGDGWSGLPSAINFFFRRCAKCGIRQQTVRFTDTQHLSGRKDFIFGGFQIEA